MAKTHKFSEDLADRIVNAVRAGAFLWIAAEAAGISERTLYQWLRLQREPYLSFQRELGAASAQARLYAETWVYHNRPLAWLTLGPGRTKPGQDGWTDPAPKDLSDPRREQAFLEWTQLQQRILEALAPYPEAKKAVAQALVQAVQQQALPAPAS
jgi:hypothetical protein